MALVYKFSYKNLHYINMHKYIVQKHGKPQIQFISFT